jgi:hypothetical protein
MEWHSVADGRPPGGHPYGLMCVDARKNVAYALGWFDHDSGEWCITAYPIGSDPVEIWYWCDLGEALGNCTQPDPWPAIVPYVENGAVELRHL